MHILLTILKILGIIILCILGIIIFVLATLLFAPFRYSFDARKDEDASIKESVVKGKVTWMWFILRCKYIYEDGQSLLKIRIFGIDIDKLKRLRKKKVSKEVKKTSSKYSKKEPLNLDSYKKENKPVNKPGTGSNSIEQEAVEVKEHNNFARKIKAKFIGIKDKLKSIKTKILGIKDKIKGIISKISYYKEELGKDENKVAIRFTWEKIKEVLNHIKPIKLKGNITFGMDAPDKTGQALGVIAIMYPLYGENFTVKPNFNEGCLYGDFIAKGRIRLFTLLVICIKLIRSNEFKKLRVLIGK